MSDETTVEAGAEVTATDQAGAEAEVSQAPVEPAVEAPIEPSPEGSWYTDIQDEKLREFAGRFTTPEELAKTALQFRQKLSNAVTLPGKNASDEEMAEFRSKLGVPESPDDYGLQAPDLPDGVDVESVNAELTALAKSLHEAGATPAVAKAVQDARIQQIISGTESSSERLEAVQREQTEALRKQWGGDFDVNVKYAARGFKQFAGEGSEEFLSKTIDGVPLGDHPMFLSVFANVGRKMGEGGLHTVLDDGDKATMQEEMDTLTSEAHDALSRGDRSKANALFAKREALASKFYGAAS